jgi:cell wall-associated NlpC family hydrolase
VSLALAFVAMLPLGCAPKKITIYEPSPIRAVKNDIAEYAVTLLGTPYKSGSKGPSAFDCSGFVHYVYEHFQVALPVSTEGLTRIGSEVSRNDVTPGDLVVFRIKGEMHVGIVINALEFVHASKSRGVAIDSLDIPYWQRTFLYFRRIL